MIKDELCQKGILIRNIFQLVQIVFIRTSDIWCEYQNKNKSGSKKVAPSFIMRCVSVIQRFYIVHLLAT